MTLAWGRRYSGRDFTDLELDRVRQLIARNPGSNRVHLSRLVCEEFQWLRPNGQPKDMSCRVAMLRMERDGLIVLPPPERGNGNGRTRPVLTSASESREALSVVAGSLTKCAVRPVANREESSLWNELIERYHYLGYKPLPGAQLRYVAFQGQSPLALLGFGAAAWAVAPRDRFVGWNAQTRVQNLHRVVNNARFLVLPWVNSPNLASKLFSIVARRLPEDWEILYGYRPVLLETFVERARFRGTCYRASNWISVGETQGRGKKDRQHRHALPVKEVFLYPLISRFRSELCSQR